MARPDRMCPGLRLHLRLEHLVARSKLELEPIQGDFTGGPLTADSREFVVTCRRPAE